MERGGPDPGEKLGALATAARRGGIAARSKRGAIGETWWSKRFIELLESFGVGSRLQRGRNYARRGQVVELEVEPGVVLAKVQGSRYTPYRVRIRGKALTEQQWRRVGEGDGRAGAAAREAARRGDAA